MGIADLWYSKNLFAILLFPLSWVFRMVVAMRRVVYRWRNRFCHPFPVPVIVVGNISVGGTGKTPLVIWMVDFLRSNGFSPGVISRGYGGSSKIWPQSISPQSDPLQVGDEPVLIASRCHCPVYAAPRRLDAAKALLAEHQCDVIISDDGLQHYALVRDIEIAVVDGERGLGSGYCLPAGPLREPVQRLKQVDFVVINGKRRVNGVIANREYNMQLRVQRAVNLADVKITRLLDEFRGQTVYAIAGIGHPRRYFNMLRELGLKVNERPFPDHYKFTSEDLKFVGQAPVLMTEKDAIKIRNFARSNFWYLPVTAELSPEFSRQLLARLRG